MLNRTAFMLASTLSTLSVGMPLQYAHAAKPDFNGAWSVQWCDKANPGRDCGGFYVPLLQEGDRLCGSYSGVRVRLSQIDEGGSRAIRGVVVGDTAVLTIESGRSGAIYLVSADVHGDRMRWKQRETVRESDQDIDIIANDDELRRRPPGNEVSEQRADTIAACRAVNKNG